MSSDISFTNLADLINTKWSTLRCREAPLYLRLDSLRCLATTDPSRNGPLRPQRVKGQSGHICIGFNYKSKYERKKSTQIVAKVRNKKQRKKQVVKLYM